MPANDPPQPLSSSPSLRGLGADLYRSPDICGVDEAGRGPLAGPVAVAAVILDPERPISGLADSKTLSAAARDDLYDEIMAKADVSLVLVSSARIDALNIRAATLWGMARAVDALPVRPRQALIDGRDVPPGLSVPAEALVKGDQLSPAISAASIIAKVTRDRVMARLCSRYPQYGFSQHMGYPTAQHKDALLRYGPCPHHRRSFRPVREALAFGAP